LRKIDLSFNKKHLLLLPIAFILLVTLFICVAYPPNNYDSMTYHMARIMHWIDNGSVEFYQTHEPRQLYQPPLAEYAIMHLQILTNGDYFANTVQWLCFVFCIMTVFLLAFEITRSSVISIIASIIASTIPMAILQSSSTQNDLVVSGFIVAFVLCLIRLQHKITFKNTIFAGIALGLAIATKGTALIYCLAIGLSFSIALIYKLKEKSMMSLLAIVLIGFILNGFFFYRTHQKYGNIIPASEATIYKNIGNPMKNIYQNAIRNILLHTMDLGYDANKYIFLFAKTLLGNDMSNPDNTFGPSFVPQRSRHEDTAGNSLHMLLILLSLIFVLKIKNVLSLPLISSVILGFFLFCLILKWQPWGSRLQLPLFILSCPVIASFIYEIFDKQAQIFIIAVLFISSMPYLFKNESRNLLSFDWLNKTRNELMFNSNPGIYRDYCIIADSVKLKNAEYMKILLKKDQYEYPFWVMSGKKIK
jgi:4-amino-4-deoxy-L-arabinose transferase-like glycosyltransferase